MANPSPLLSGDRRPRIIYGCVLRPPKVMLAEHSDVQGNIQEVLANVLDKLGQSAEWKSYIYGEHAFHYIADQATSLCFLCMAEKDMGRRIPFAFLDKVQESFKEQFSAETIKAADAQSLMSDYQAFRSDIRDLMAKYNSPNADRVQNMMGKVQHINDNLMESIDKILERQEKIDVLVQRSEVLATSSTTFRREAQTLARVMWWRNAKVLACLSFSALAFIGVVIWVEAS